MGRYDFWDKFWEFELDLLTCRLELCATSTDWRDAPDKRGCKSRSRYVVFITYQVFEHGIFRSTSVVPSHTPLKYHGSVIQLYAKMSSLVRKTMRSGLERSFGHVVWSMTWKFYQMVKKLRLERKV